MKKAIYIFICFLFCGINLPAQGVSPCLPSPDGAPAGDEPPGCFLCDSLYVGTTVGYTAGLPGDSLYPCGVLHNNQFISFIANSSGDFEGRIFASDCLNGQGVQAIIYDQSFTPVSNCFSSFHWGEIFASDLVPGEIYWLMIDGFSGDICDILLTVSSGFIPNCEFIPTIQPTDASFICLDNPTEIEVNISCNEPFLWKVDSTGEILSGQGTNKVSIQWSTSGSKCIEIQIDSSCYESMIVKDTFEVLEEMPYLPITELVCAETPLPLMDTLIEINEMGCPYFQVRNFVHRQTSIQNIYEEICFGDTATIEGTNEVFTTEGVYLVKLDNLDQFGCDSTVRLNLSVPTSVENLRCQTTENNIIFNWNELSNADGYAISIDDVFIRNTIFLNFSISNLDPSVSKTITVQPFSNDSICHFAFVKRTCTTDTDIPSNIEILPNKPNIIILPNPTSGKVQINSSTSVEWIRVFDISGREILHSTEVEIDLSGQAAGIYFFKVKTGNGVITKRVILL